MRIKETKMSIDETGYLVFKVAEPDALNDLFWEAIAEMPEYLATIGRYQVDHPKVVLGGFGALANPSSFHHPNVQKLRLMAKTAVRPHVARWVKTTKHEVVKANADRLNLEGMFDRIAVRSAAQGTPTAEAWHRDVYCNKVVHERAAYKNRIDAGPLKKNVLPDDVLFGGFMNCNGAQGENLYFSCVPGDYELFLNGKGFMTLPNDVVKEMNKKRTEPVVIPPGHAIIFLQGLMHEIVSKTPSPIPSARMFLGYRVTTDTENVFGNEIVSDWIKNGTVPRIPSGQIPPAWAKSHACFHKQKIEDFVRNLAHQMYGRYFGPLGEERAYKYDPENLGVLMPTKLVE